jgi:hypothetical protein
MLRKLLGAVALITFTVLISIPTLAAPENNTNRVSSMYTTWDDYYFYAAFEVSDPDVVGRNTTPVSQPQQDDDIEVFINTSNTATEQRTASTYQMAVSAAGGAYFSVGGGTAVPKAKVVYTYKYAAKVDGTLNDPTDGDVGYTIEIAIPWQELGLAGPPKSGTTWGFNVISRDVSSSAVNPPRFYSLSPLVTSRSDVQNPSKWSLLTFSSGMDAPQISRAHVVSPHITSRCPLINGSVVSGEWPSESRFSFEGIPVTAAPPTSAEEPNTDSSPFAEPPTGGQSSPPQAQPNSSQTSSVPDTNTGTSNTTPTIQYPSISLPGGGSIKVVPGGIKTPAGLGSSPDAPTQIVRRPRNPLTPKYSTDHQPATSDASLTGSLSLTPKITPSLIMAIYRIDYNADSRKGIPQNVWDTRGRTLLIDQPINASGPWFSGLRSSWHRQQLADLRRSGIDVALVRATRTDPLLARELDALTQALKDMKASGQDYPMIAMDMSGSDPVSPSVFYSHIPKEFRLVLESKSDPTQRDLVAYAGTTTPHSEAVDGVGLHVITDDAKVTVVTPGGVAGTTFIGRHNGNTYATSWQHALDAHSDFVIINSWNDFTNGTELAASRQYGEEYADQTRLQSISFNGDKQWHAKYIAASVPAVVRPGTLYQIPLRVENAGTLPWRAGEGYSLCTRWYKDGRLFDDSAPRIPIGKDVLPGQTVDLSVGLVAMNSYGDNLEAGKYTLVFDVVQDQDRWFSYASDAPLQVPVTVVSATAATDTLEPEANFLSASTPTTVVSGATYSTHVSIRHEDTIAWTPDMETVGYKILSLSDTGKMKSEVEAVGSEIHSTLDHPGDIVVSAPTITIADGTGKPLSPGSYVLHWFIKSKGDGPVVKGSYDEAIEVISPTAAPSFVLSDIQRSVAAGKEGTADLAIQNLGTSDWKKGDLTVGYHWYFLDGQEAVWDSPSFASFTKDVPVRRADGDIVTKFRAPAAPGRYILTWDVRAADGTWESTTPSNLGNDLLPVIVTVTGNGNVTAVDLTKYFDCPGIAADESGAGAGLDGHGSSLPAAILPPDNVAEIDANPLLLGKPGPPLYPAGYYSGMTGPIGKSAGWYLQEHTDISCCY